MREFAAPEASCPGIRRRRRASVRAIGRYWAGVGLFLALICTRATTTLQLKVETVRATHTYLYQERAQS